MRSRSPRIARSDSSCPDPAGGSTDIVSRFIGSKLSDALKRPVVIENRGGASGMIGAEAVAKSAPDGLTLLMTASGPHSINPSLFPKLPYDPARDSTPIVLTAVYPLLMVVPADHPARDVRSFIAWAQANRGKVNYCSIGPGTPSHLAGELFRAMAGIEMTHIPYKGSSQAITDAIAGQCAVLFDSALSSGPQVKAGELRALAITSKDRVASWQQLPTVAESGLPGYEAYTWTALVAPAGTPRELIARYNIETNRVLSSAEYREKLDSQGAVPGGGTPEQLAAFAQAETAKWAKVIREGNITAE
jgi:tripartite-type tricarboxylate transporter receptor subunit TctC